MIIELDAVDQLSVESREVVRFASIREDIQLVARPKIAKLFDDIQALRKRVNFPGLGNECLAFGYPTCDFRMSIGTLKNREIPFGHEQFTISTRLARAGAFVDEKPLIRRAGPRQKYAQKETD